MPRPYGLGRGIWGFMERNSIRLRNYDYTSNGVYFITICSYQREQIFGSILENQMKNSTIGQIIQGCWNEIPLHFQNVQLDSLVIMPNHIYGLILIHPPTILAKHEPNPTVGARHASPSQSNDILSQARKELALSPLRTNTNVVSGVPARSLGAIVGSFKSAVTKRSRIALNNDILQVWQRNYFERVIRNDRELNGVRDYIAHNPQNWLFDFEANSDAVLHDFVFSSLEVAA